MPRRVARTTAWARSRENGSAPGATSDVAEIDAIFRFRLAARGDCGTAGGMGQGSLFSTRFTFGLAAYLIGATALVFATPLEICPSVILPGGGKPVRVKNGVVRFTSPGLWGRALGERKRIVVRDLLGPIPDPYVYSVARNGFGTTELKPLRVKFGPFDFKVSRPERSPEARKEVVAWLKRRLREAGFADDRFFVRRDEIELEIQSDREIGRRKQHEQTVRLY